MKTQNTIFIILAFILIAFLYSYFSGKIVNGITDHRELAGYSGNYGHISIATSGSLSFEGTEATTIGAGTDMFTVPDSLLYTVGIGELVVDASVCFTSTLQFGGNSDAKITIDFDKDSILINYEGKLNEAGKVFIDFCREYGGRPIYDEILELAEEYKKHCYNDSTIMGYMIFPLIGKQGFPLSVIDSFDKQLRLDGLHSHLISKEVRIIHKQPTFADFLDWLEKRKK